MNPLLSKNLYLVKEKIGMFKAANHYDIFDAENNQHIMSSTEPNLGFFTKVFRFTKYKSKTPFYVEVKTANGEKVVSLKRGIAFFRSDVAVFNNKDQQIGFFKQKFWSLGGKFEISDMQNKPVCTLEGKWTGWDFKFTNNGKELAIVTKKWAGIGKEFFTTADNYILKIDDSVAPDDKIREFIVAAVLCIDMVLKER